MGRFTFSTGGVVATTVNLMTATLGPGMLTYPDAVQQSGILLWLACLFVVTILAYYSLVYVAAASAKVKKITYGEVAEATLGPKWKYVAEIFFFINNYGASVSFMVLFHQNANSIATMIDSKIIKLPSWITRSDTMIWIGLLSIMLVPMVVQRSLKELKFVSLFGLTTILYLASVIVVYAFNSDFYDIDPNIDRIVLSRPQGIMISFSEMIYSFQCHQYIMLAYSELNGRSIRRMSKVIARQILLCSAIYMAVGIFGYITFSEKDLSKLQNFLIAYDPEEHIPIIIGIGSLTVTLVCCLPFVLRPTKESLSLFLASFFKKTLTPSNTKINKIDGPLTKEITIPIIGRPTGSGSQEYTALSDRQSVPYQISTSLSTHVLLSLVNLGGASLIATYCILASFSLNRILTFTSAVTSCVICFFFPALFYRRTHKPTLASGIILYGSVVLYGYSLYACLYQ